MKLFGKYLWLELKRSFQVLKKTLLNFILIIVLLATAVMAVSYTMLQSQIFGQIEIGVSAPGEDSITQAVVQVISAMRSVRSICDFRYMDEETAMAEMEKGNLQAVILLPVNFYEDVDSGMNSPAQILIPKDASLNVKVFLELLKDGVSLLQTSEAGVYATYDLIQEEKPIMKKNKIGDSLVEQYVLIALERQKIYEEQVVSPFGYLDVAQFYYLSAYMIILLMVGLNMGYLYREQSRAMEQKLMIYGLGTWKRSLIKMLIMTGILYFLSLLMYGVGVLLTSYTPLLLVYWTPGVLRDMLLLCITISAYFHVIYVLTGSGAQGASVLLAANAGMIIASGLILPIAYFPEVIQWIGRVLPLRFWTEYAIGFLYDRLSAAQILVLLVITIIELGIGGIISWRKS